MEFYPFGHICWQVLSEPNDHRFPGQCQDWTSGFNYNWHRYYDHELGRYRQADPQQNSGEANRYMYALANPLSNIDPTGLKTWILAVAAGSGTVVRFLGVESGYYYLIDPSKPMVHEFLYVSVGPGLGIKLQSGWYTGAAQVEFGIYDGPNDPSKMHNWSLAISAFAAAGKGISGQLTGTSFWGGGDLGGSLGVAGGVGAGISGFVTRSWYQGSSDVIPDNIKSELIHYINFLIQTRNSLEEIVGCR